MAQKEGRPDSRWIGRDFHMIFRKSRTSRWELTAPSSRSLIADKDIPLSESLPARYLINYNGPKNEASLAAIRGGEKRVARIGGGLAAISP